MSTPPTPIHDRADVFYWQTDRAVEPEEAGKIWADRHSYFSETELIDRANSVLQHQKIVSVHPLHPDAQTNLGNVNSVRIGVLESGEEVIIRAHPKGIPNGYFFAEAAAAQHAIDAGLPSYQTIGIHEYEGVDDFAFHLMEKLPGKAVQVWLEEHPEDEEKMVRAMGRCMARIHQISVRGFGPFSNSIAKDSGALVGVHQSFVAALRAALGFNLEVLVAERIFSDEQATMIDRLFSSESSVLQVETPVLVHNDFADWNVLTDGNEITGIIDWDECVGGSPVSDIACWSTFFEPERMENFLAGYWEMAEKPTNFEEFFELLRLRYTISKMTLRIRRFSWEPTEAIKTRIEYGKKHLAISLQKLGV